MQNLQIWLLQYQSLLIFLTIILLLVLVAFAFLLLKRSSVFGQISQSILETQNSLQLVQQQLKDSQQQLDDKLSLGQQQLFTSMLEDRERQLLSISQLRIELEKRFAESGLGLSNNIQQFQSEMIERFEKLQNSSALTLAEGQQKINQTIHSFTEKSSQTMGNYQLQTKELIRENIGRGLTDLRLDLDRSMLKQNQSINQSIASLTDNTDKRLKDISGQVEKRLSEGFDKTTKTFSDVLKRLALIDDAQKKITELSTNVVSLQEILNDKRSRGAFGEVQLQSLVSNVMPDSHYSMQQKLSNDKIADCILSLPEPTGKIAIDAKFPLESYKRMMDLAVAQVDRKEAAKQFSRDVKKHISDIGDKYVLPPETANGAVMFIPAESIFAEIHGHYPELVEYAYQRKVWLVSPTTLMAILTTATAVIKDEQTRQQVHIIKEHLSILGKDFMRFQGRMDNLSKHIGQVSKDVEQVHTSAKKISSRFDRIERVELTEQKTDKAIIDGADNVSQVIFTN